MELAKSCRYAIQALLHLAGRERLDEPVMLRDIAAAIEAPEAFLSKIFQALRASGIVRSHRGVIRGYTMARDPKEITLYDLILATEGSISLHTPEVTAQEAGEAFGGVWHELEDLVAARLRSISVFDLARQSSREGEINPVLGDK